MSCRRLASPAENVHVEGSPGEEPRPRPTFTTSVAVFGHGPRPMAAAFQRTAGRPRRRGDGYRSVTEPEEAGPWQEIARPRAGRAGPNWTGRPTRRPRPPPRPPS